MPTLIEVRRADSPSAGALLDWDRHRSRPKQEGVIMEVPLAVLADSANVSQEGKLNIMGIFSQINAQSLPLQYPHMALVFSLVAQVPETGRTHQAVISCMDEDGGKLFEANATIEVNVEDPSRPATINQIINLQLMEFRKEGDYSFNILLNNELKRSVTLTVKLVG